MPVHISENGLEVLDQNGAVVPGGSHKTHAEALAHEQAMNMALRREEGRPVAPKQEKGIPVAGGFDWQKLSQEERDAIPAEDFVDPQGRRFYIRSAADVSDAVSSYGRANPKIPYDKFRSRLTAIARRKGFEASLPEEWKKEEKAVASRPPQRPSPVDEQDPVHAVGDQFVDGREKPANTQVTQEQQVNANAKSSWLLDPTEDEWMVFLTGDDPTLHEFKSGKTKGAPPYVDPDMGDMLTDRAFYHHSPERYQYRPAQDWNNDLSSLPPTWLRAHPYGNPYTKSGKDAHGEYFDRRTNFYEKEKIFPEGVPVSYYHNFNPDGTPSGDPTVIGRTVAREYRDDGRWDKVVFDNGMDPDIKARLAKALASGTLRASPTVVPDFHEVDQNGHIKNWLTGSIAVLDAEGGRQPASPKAIGIPAMKALFQKAQIVFPKKLEDKTMARTTKGRFNFSKAGAFLKALAKAMLDEETPAGEAQAHEHLHAHPAEKFDGHGGPLDENGQHSHAHDESPEHHGEHEMTEEKALFEDSNPEDSATAPYGLGNNFWTTEYNGPQSDRDRYDGGVNFQKGNLRKDVQGLAHEEENIAAEERAAAELGPLGDQRLRLDMKPTEKALMKAQIAQLQRESDEAKFSAWFDAQVAAGKTLPAERGEIRVGYMQAVHDDRTSRPLMKSAQTGTPIQRVAMFKRVVEQRASHFGEMQMTGNVMKSAGLQVGGFGASKVEQEWNESRRQQLLSQSPLGQKILSEQKQGGK